MQDVISDWLAEIGRPFGLDLALDENGAAGLGLGDGTLLVVEAEPELGAVHLHAEVLRLPDDAVARAAMLEEAMALNLHARRTEGATLGLDRRSDALILSISRQVAELDGRDFAALLTAFAETVAALRAELGGGPAPSGEAATVSAMRLVDPRLLA